LLVLKKLDRRKSTVSCLRGSSVPNHDDCPYSDTTSDDPSSSAVRSPDHLYVPSDLETMLRDESSRPHPIPLQDLKAITDNFSHNRILGQGGFGVVYKVNHWLLANPKEVLA
jgi:hypothetical protein